MQLMDFQILKEDKFKLVCSVEKNKFVIPFEHTAYLK